MCVCVWYLRYTYLLDLAVQDAQPALVVGPTGTGKSVLVSKYLYTLPADSYVPPNVIGFSARTTANTTQVGAHAMQDTHNHTLTMQHAHKTSHTRAGTHGPGARPQVIYALQ